MKFSLIFCVLSAFLVICAAVPLIKKSVVHVRTTTATGPGGIWKKKTVWKPRWVKTWEERRFYVSVWKRMWGPVEINEWVPLPKPPPGWLKIHH